MLARSRFLDHPWFVVHAIKCMPKRSSQVGTLRLTDYSMCRFLCCQWIWDVNTLKTSKNILYNAHISQKRVFFLQGLSYAATSLTLPSRSDSMLLSWPLPCSGHGREGFVWPPKRTIWSLRELPSMKHNETCLEYFHSSLMFDGHFISERLSLETGCSSAGSKALMPTVLCPCSNCQVMKRRRCMKQRATLKIFNHKTCWNMYDNANAWKKSIRIISLLRLCKRSAQFFCFPALISL